MTEMQALERYARNGDPDAFRHLVTCYQRMVYAACARMLREQQDIEDAVQETFLKLAQHAGRIKHGVSSWLYTAATRTALDRIRRDSTRRRHELAWRPEPADGSVDDFRELLIEVDMVIADLPEAQREAVVGYFLEGRTQTQMAEEQGVTQSAMARRVERAVKELRQRLAKRGVTASAAGLGAFFAADAAQAQVPGVLTTALVKVGLSGAGTGAVAGGGGVLGAMAQWSLAAKLAAGIGLAGAVAGGAYVTVTQQASAPVVAAAVAADPDLQVDPRLQGIWSGYNTLSPDVTIELEFVGSSVRYLESSGFVFEGTVVHNDPDANPPQLQVRVDTSEDEAIVGKPYHAIYRVADDGVLKLVTNQPGAGWYPEGFGEPPVEEYNYLAATKTPAAEAMPVGGDQAAGDPYAPADHGLELVPMVRPGMLALTNRITVSEAQVPIGISMGYMMMGTVVNNARLEPTGGTVTMYDENEQETDEHGRPKLHFTLAVPVAWEDKVPEPFKFTRFEAFHCVAYQYTGSVMEADPLWDKVIAQALFDGYEPTGVCRFEEVEWVGPQSDENVFSMQLGVVPND